MHLIAKYFIKNLIALNDYDSILLSAVLANIIFSFVTTIYLFKLTRLLFKNDQLAYLSSMFFIFNPASVFFVAPYSESIFFMLTVTSLYNLYKSNYFASTLLFSLSCLARSNGLINFLFVGFFIIKAAMSSLLGSNLKTVNTLNLLKLVFCQKNIIMLSKMLLKLLITLICFLASFSLYQFYIYNELCLKQIDQTKIPIELLEYGKANSYAMNGFSWCDKFLPFSYTDIQSKYWNVGFLKYWKFRQIPNFLLATPVLLISVIAIISFLHSIKHKNYLSILFDIKQEKRTSDDTRELFGEYQNILFVFALHLIFITITCTFFMHVQVNSLLIICCFQNFNFSFIQ